MRRGRHDVLFFDSDRMRLAEFMPTLEVVCNIRSASTIAKMKEELAKCRPDVFGYCYSVGDEAVLTQICEILSQPEYEYIQVCLVVKLQYQERIVEYFPTRQIMIQNDVKKGQESAEKIKAFWEELDALPQVMVVEKDDNRRGSFVNCLEDWAVPISLKDPEEAIEVLANHQVDVLVLSAVFGEKIYNSVFDRIRGMDNGKNLPILFLAANADKETVLRCVQRGAVGMLKEPYDRNEVKKHVMDAANGVKEGRKKTVLVCDDDIMILKTLQRVLEDEYCVVGVNSAEQAIRYCANHVPDIVLLDYEMPDRSGLYVVKRLRMDERFNNCPIVMLTGNKERETVVACVSAGAQGYLTKPVNAMALRLRVRQLVGSVS